MKMVKWEIFSALATNKVYTTSEPALNMESFREHLSDTGELMETIGRLVLAGELAEAEDIGRVPLRIGRIWYEDGNVENYGAWFDYDCRVDRFERKLILLEIQIIPSVPERMEVR